MREKINADLKEAMKSGDKDRVSTLRLINAAIKSADIDARPTGKDKISDTDILSVLAKMVKQRRDSIVQFEAGKRMDLVAVEQGEVAVLQGYQPAQMSETEIDAAIAAAIASTGASGPAGMGKVMAELKGKLAGRADMGAVSARVKAKLAS